MNASSSLRHGPPTSVPAQRHRTGRWQRSSPLSFLASHTTARCAPSQTRGCLGPTRSSRPSALAGTMTCPRMLTRSSLPMASDTLSRPTGMRRMRRPAKPHPLPGAALPQRALTERTAHPLTEGGSQHRLGADAALATRTRMNRPSTMAATATPFPTTRLLAPLHPPQSLAMMTLLCLHEQSSLGRLKSHRILQTLQFRIVTMNSPLARRIASLRLCVVDLSSLFQAVLVFGALLARHYPMGVRRGTPPSCPRHGSASVEASRPRRPLSLSR